MPPANSSPVPAVTRLSGLRVAVTGGTSGLGLALVRALASQGASVAFVALGRARVEQPAAELPGIPGIVAHLSRKFHPVISLPCIDRSVFVNDTSSVLFLRIGSCQFKFDLAISGPGLENGWSVGCIAIGTPITFIQHVDLLIHLLVTDIFSGYMIKYMYDYGNSYNLATSLESGRAVDILRCDYLLADE